MKRTRRTIRRHLAALLVSACAICLALPSISWAQPRRAEEPEPPRTKSYALSYLLTVVLVSGGMLLVCRPVYRKREVD
jgi:uncharacterized membrane protein YidH (DUF202 family)